MRARLQHELEHLRERYPKVEHKDHGGEDWFRLPRYRLPDGWRLNGKPVSEVSIVFKIGAAYPSGEAYSFAAPAGLDYKGTTPVNTSSAAGCPFEGSWLQFSWAPEGWAPASDVRKGSNLLAWVRSFAQRFEQGA
jgi:hypothetical protein